MAGFFSAIDQGRSRHRGGPFSSSGGGAPTTRRPIIEANILEDAGLFTDEFSLSAKVGAIFAGYQVTVHSAKACVRGLGPTNTVEGCFFVFKRGMKGVYQHCAKQYLHRYLAELYNNRVKLGC